VSAPDFAGLGLLDGLDEEARAPRLALLQALHAEGVPVADLRTAVAEGRLALLPAERALGAEGEITPRQLAEEAGLDLAMLEAVRRASGLALPPADVAALGPLDRAGAGIIARFLEAGLPIEGLIEAARVFGEATAHAAAAAGTLANTSIPREGDTELGYALRLAAATRELTPPAAELLGVLYRLHTRENLRQQIIGAGELASGRRSDVLEVSVGFCDLVGFTKLGEGVPAADLGAIATRLAALAADVAEPPVRLVKTLGDAVMFVAPEPAPLLDAAFGLMEVAAGEGESFPEVHAGAAHGMAVRRWGDYYGGPVNLAARLAERARPGALLTDGAVRELAGDTAFAWSPARAKRLKGMSEPTAVWRCRRRPAGAPQATG
jgi:adenylate cyclase